MRSLCFILRIMWWSPTLKSLTKIKIRQIGLIFHIMDSIIVNLDCFLNSPCYYLFSLMETTQFDIGIENPKPFELSFIHYTFITIFYTKHNCSYGLQTTKTTLPRLCWFHCNTAHNTLQVTRISTVTRQPPLLFVAHNLHFLFFVSMASLFSCLLFTYRLRRRGIPVACLLTRMMLLEYQWVKKSVTSFIGTMEEAARFPQHLWQASSLALHRPGKL